MRIPSGKTKNITPIMVATALMVSTSVIASQTVFKIIDKPTNPPKARNWNNTYVTAAKTSEFNRRFAQKFSLGLKNQPPKESSTYIKDIGVIDIQEIEINTNSAEPIERAEVATSNIYPITQIGSRNPLDLGISIADKHQPTEKPSLYSSPNSIKLP